MNLSCVKYSDMMFLEDEVLTYDERFKKIYKKKFKWMIIITL